jgi:eukaryotic-like serine/threonine-protein kinase
MSALVKRKYLPALKVVERRDNAKMTRPEDNLSKEHQPTQDSLPTGSPMNTDIPDEDVDAGLAAAFGQSRLQSETEKVRRAIYASGDTIANRYRLIEQIGEGGMGTVWYAEQLVPVKRKVAIKLIKPGLDSQSVLARFDAERQALALMDHPNIARVFDGGITDLGHPFFVMELVRGTAITTWCDENRKGLRERLELMIPVCQAIQHAHQKGIIHRDIKPSNIMVALFDGKPVPKVIDFGVAKAFGTTLTDMSLHTDYGEVVGTAEYMSPEQAELNNLDIDTRSDVYSLGVLMYELLAGSPPFSRGDLAERGWHEILRVIREVDPQRPSVKLSTSKARANIAAMRSIEPAALGKLLKSELDWIVMKSLEKERSRRYESASAMASDLLRYLSDETVEACPPSWNYRFRKFEQRHRWQVIGSLLFLVTLVAGIIGTSWGLIRAESQRKVAEEARKIADERAEGERLAKLDAQRHQKLAEEAEDETLESFRASTDSGIEDLLGSKLEFGPQERRYLETTLRRWQAFADRQGDDARSLAIRAEGHYRVGGIQHFFGDTGEAKKAITDSIAIWELLVENFPTVARNQLGLAKARILLAKDYMGQKDFENAEAQYRRTVESCKQQMSNFPFDNTFALTLGEAHTELARLLSELERISEAEDEYKQGLQVLEKLATDFPQEAEYRFKVARSQSNLGNLLSDLGRHSEAEKLISAALATSISLVADYPDDSYYQRDLADRHISLGRLLCYYFFRLEEGIEHFRSGVEIYEKLAAEFPSVIVYRKDLAEGYNLMAGVLKYQGKFDEATRQLRTSVKLNERLYNDYPNSDEHRFALSMSYVGLGELVKDQGNPEESLNWYNKGIELVGSIEESHEHTTQSRNTLIACLIGRAYALAELKQDKPSDWEAVRESIRPDGTQKIQIVRAILLLRAGNVKDSLAEMDELIRMANNTDPDSPWNSSHWYDAACFFSIACTKAPDRQQEFVIRAIELLNRAIESGYVNIEHMMRDTDLSPLRDTEEFKELLENFRYKLNSNPDKP